MIRNNILAALASAVMLALPISAARPSPVPPNGPVHAARICRQVRLRHQHRAGPEHLAGGVGTLLYRGQHPQSEPARIVLTYKVAIAAQGEPGPMTAFQPPWS